MTLAAGDVLAQVRFPANTGLPEDETVNDFTFQWEDIVGPTGPDYTALMDALVDFYTSDAGGPDTVSAFLSGSLDHSALAASVNLYRLPDEPGLMGSPVAQQLFTLAAPLGTRNLPSEVAVCNSIHADLTDIPSEVGSTRPRARRRGRQFIGPLRDGAMTDTDTEDPQVITAFQDALELCSQTLLDATTGIPDKWQWSVFSRTEWVMRAVVGGWIDNAFDTIRSRGQEATSRRTWAPL